MKNLILALILAGSSLLQVSCQNKKSASQVVKPNITELRQNPGTVAIFHERTPCFGVCPSYTLRIYDTGYAEFNGRQFVDMIGVYDGIVEEARMDSIFQIAEEIGFWGMDDRYDNKLVMDLPSITTELWEGEKNKMVFDRYKSPQELKQIYSVIDHLILSTSWEGQSSTPDR